MLLDCFTFVSQDYRADSPRVDCLKGCSGWHLHTIGNYILMRLCSQWWGQPAKLSCITCQSEVNDLHIKFYFFYTYILCVNWLLHLNMAIREILKRFSKAFDTGVKSCFTALVMASHYDFRQSIFTHFAGSSTRSWLDLGISGCGFESCLMAKVHTPIQASCWGPPALHLLDVSSSNTPD